MNGTSPRSRLVSSFQGPARRSRISCRAVPNTAMPRGHQSSSCVGQYVGVHFKANPRRDCGFTKAAGVCARDAPHPVDHTPRQIVPIGEATMPRPGGDMKRKVERRRGTEQESKMKPHANMEDRLSYDARVRRWESECTVQWRRRKRSERPSPMTHVAMTIRKHLYRAVTAAPATETATTCQGGADKAAELDSRMREIPFHSFSGSDEVLPDMEGGMHPVELEIRRASGLSQAAPLRPPPPRTFSKLIAAIGHATDG